MFDIQARHVIEALRSGVPSRNNLQGKGNLWYEEYVPRGSVFFTIIHTPDEPFALPLNNAVVRFGANESIGYGFMKLTEITGGANNGEQA